MSELVSAREASRRLGIAHQTAINWFNDGKFPNAFRVEATIRIPLSDVDALKGNTDALKQREAG